MKRIFADSFYFIAMLSPSDASHVQAVEWTKSFRGRLVTTDWVLTEVGDGLAQRPHLRRAFLGLYDALQRSSTTTVVPATVQLGHRGISLYRNRLDKEWSLTDCISFVVMQDEGILEALTGDRHFEQAGFSALLK